MLPNRREKLHVPSNGKIARPANRRHLIIKAAARLFCEKGFERTTVRDLADAVGMNSGSLFFHFRSKDAILQEVLEDGLTRALDTLENSLANADSPSEKLRAVFHSHLRAILDEKRDAFIVVLRDWRNLSRKDRKRIIALRDEYERQIGVVVDQCAKAAHISVDSRLLRLFILGALNWTIQWYRDNGELTIAELADEFLGWCSTMFYRAQAPGTYRPSPR